MSEKKLIGITLIPKEIAKVDIEELAATKVYRTWEGRYQIEEREVIDAAIKQILEAKEESTPSMTFFVIEITPKARRRRRGRRTL